MAFHLGPETQATGAGFLCGSHSLVLAPAPLECGLFYFYFVVRPFRVAKRISWKLLFTVYWLVTNLFLESLLCFLVLPVCFEFEICLFLFNRTMRLGNLY